MIMKERINVQLSNYFFKYPFRMKIIQQFLLQVIIFMF